MTYARSFSPNGIPDPNPDFMLCNGAYHAITAAKVYSMYLFVICLFLSGFNFLAFGADKGWLSLFCVSFTIYSIAVIYGVFLEKRYFIIFSLIIQTAWTVLTIIITLAYLGLGAFTDFISDQHKNSQALRDLYSMHGLDPDLEQLQTITASSVLFFLVFSSLIQCYGWYVMFRTYQCFAENDRTVVPNSGYSRGIIAENTNDE